MPIAAVTPHISAFQAIILGLLQGVTELFPISSLGHTVLFPHLFGWSNIVRWQAQPESPWLAFIVMLHVGSAVGLLIYFWRDWIDIVKAFFATLGKRRIETSTERLAWLIIAASIPTGILGLALEHPARTATAKPLVAACFLVVNGIILIGAERLRRSANARARQAEVRSVAETRGAGGSAAVAVADGPIVATEEPADVRVRTLDTLDYKEAAGIGLAQATALIAGISRDGVVMATGLLRGLDNYDAGRFAFLLATPIILAAGIFKFSDLTGPLGAGIRGAAVLAAVVAAVAAVLTVHFLTRYFRRGNLNPFGIYCLIFGVAMVTYNL